MQKVSYMGNGSTTEFTFNFPYFENSDVVVTMNGAAATGYNIVGTSGGLDADIPYIGGKVVFELAPTALDAITIARNLPLTRQYDYQPTAKIDPTTLNQDLNYLMEVIKDRQDELETLATQYAEIADKESTTTLLARISAIHDEIVAIDNKITALGDISTLRSDVSTNTENIGTLNTRTTGLLDYVIESQAPTADNNYTWYRKYKSGWVEQGGKYNALPNNSQKTVPLPIAIQSSSVGFTQISCIQTGFNSHDTLSAQVSSNGLSVELYQKNAGSAAMSVCWEIKGIIAN